VTDWGFRIATDPSFGGGHVARAVALAGGMAAGSGDQVVFFTDPANECPAAVSAAGIRCRAEAAPEAIVEICEAGRRGDIGAIICDSYAVPETAVGKLAGELPVAVFRDGGRRGPEHTSIDIHPGAEGLPGVIAGPEFAPLDPAFGRANAICARGAAIDETKQPRVLIAFGLRDSSGMAGNALEALLEYRPALSLTVATSAQSPTFDRLAALAARSPAVRLVADAPDMVPLYAGADIAVGAPGGSQFERACCGLPTVLLAQSERQRPLVAAWAASAAARHAQRPEDLPAQIAGLLENKDVVSQMSRRASGLVDGRGALRLAAALRERVGALAA